ELIHDFGTCRIGLLNKLGLVVNLVRTWRVFFAVTGQPGGGSLPGGEPEIRLGVFAVLDGIHRTLPRAKYTFVLVFAVLVGLLSLVGVKSAAAAGPCGPPVLSVIACENTLPGDPPSDWQVSGAGDAMIQGFATQMSVNAGQTESFKIDTTASSYHIDI